LATRPPYQTYLADLGSLALRPYLSTGLPFSSIVLNNNYVAINIIYIRL